MKRIFTILILTALALQAITFVIPYYWGLIYTNEEMELLAWHGYGAQLDVYGPSLYILSAVYVLVYIGLIFYKAWAKPSFLLITIISIAITPFMGITINEPINNILGYTLSLIDGAILTMLYLTSVSNEFTKSA